MINYFEKDTESEKWLIEAEVYEQLKDLMTKAFRNNFRTPGRAFRKFLDIVELHIDELQRNPKEPS